MGGGGGERREKRTASHSPVFHLFVLVPTFSTNSRENPYYTGHIYIAVIVFFVSMFWFPFGFGSKIGT